MVRGGRAEAPGPRSDVSIRLDQKTGNFKAAMVSRVMQWGALTEGKQNNELAQKEFRFIKNNNHNKGRQLRAVLRLCISVALQQKTANFKAAIASTVMQWSGLTEEKQKNQLAQAEFRFIKTIKTTTTIRAAAITCCSPAHERRRDPRSNGPEHAQGCHSSLHQSCRLCL